MITIELIDSINTDDEKSLAVSFSYSPIIVQKIKNLYERYWIPDKKFWEIPISEFNELIECLDGYELNIPQKQEILVQIPKKSVKEYIYIPSEYKFKNNPFKHQLDGIEYGLNNNKFILGDEQGLGKTMQVINIACINKKLYNYKHCLIVCGVNGLKWNWKAEVEKHSDEKAYILGTRYDKNGKEKIGSVNDRISDLDYLLDAENRNQFPHFTNIFAKMYSSYFLITNIETLRNEEIIKKLKELCDKGIINMIALDEGHKCKDPTSIQGNHLLKLQAKSMISMTGTPLMNNPLDLYIHLKWLGIEKHSFYAFKNHYCVFGGYGGYQIEGYKNLDQLKEQFGKFLLRRLKKDVLDLPEKIYTTEYIEMTPKQEQIYKDIKMDILDSIDMIKSATNPLTQLIRLRQATGYTGIVSSKIKESAKLDRLDELVEEITNNGNKILIFSNWTSITNEVYIRLQKYNPAIITGETSDRVQQQDKFMNDDTCKVIIGTIGAMGTGLTLTAGNTVIFLDEPWNRATREQAEDRAHRIGTKSNVNIIFMVCKNTIDEKIHQLVEDKGALADELIDGKIKPHDKSDLVDFLLD